MVLNDEKDDLKNFCAVTDSTELDLSQVAFNAVSCASMDVKEGKLGLKEFANINIFNRDIAQ